MRTVSSGEHINEQVHSRHYHDQQQYGNNNNNNNNDDPRCRPRRRRPLTRRHSMRSSSRLRPCTPVMRSREFPVISHHNAPGKASPGVRGEQSGWGAGSDSPLLTDGATIDDFGWIPYRRVYDFEWHVILGESLKNRIGDSRSGIKGKGDKKKKTKRQETETRTEKKVSPVDEGSPFPPLLDIPWQLREAYSETRCSYCDFLGTRYFWFLIQFSVRVTLVGMLTPAILTALQLPDFPFFSTYTLSGVVIGAGTSVGQSASFVVQFLRGSCLWLPLATLCIAVNLKRYLLVWLLVYFMVLLIIGCITEHSTRRVSLMLFSIAALDHLMGNPTLISPSHLLLDWLLGIMFGFAATILPYPLLATRSARSTIKLLFTNSATVFCGSLTCFWALSNTERSMGMVRIRRVTSSIDTLLAKITQTEELTVYEFVLFDSYEKREVRLKKAALVEQLILNLRSMTRVIDNVQDNPQIIDGSTRCAQFGESLSRSVEVISRAIEELFYGIATAEKWKDLYALDPLFDTCAKTIKKLQEEFTEASRELFYERDSLETMEEFVPLMTFFVFSVVNFWSALEDFHSHIRVEQSTVTRSVLRLFWQGLWNPVRSTMTFLRRLFTASTKADLRVVVEAVKVCVAMLLAVLFFYFVRPQLLLLSGPSVIALFSGANPVEAVHWSMVRLIATLVGSVIGFFVSSLSDSVVDHAVSLCVITAVLTFFRTGEKYGTLAMFANFVAVTSLSLTSNSTAETIISRMQQNMFAMMIYCLISVLVFPVSPGALLMKRRIKVLRSVSSIVSSIMVFYRMPGEKDADEQGSPYFTSNTEQCSLYVEGAWGNDEKNNAQHLFNHNSNTNNGKSNTDGITDLDFADSHPSVFTSAPKRDSRISALFSEVNKLQNSLRSTTKIMPFAADERGIVPRVYPHRASEAINTALYRIFALVHTMACSWKLMSEKGYFTREVRQILHYIAPIASDIQYSLHRFVNILSFYVEHPSSSLAPELAKCLMELRSLIHEFAEREHHAIFTVISETVRLQKSVSNISGEREERGGNDSGNPGRREKINTHNDNRNNNHSDNNNADDDDEDDDGGGESNSSIRTVGDVYVQEGVLNPVERRSAQTPQSFSLLDDSQPVVNATQVFPAALAPQARTTQRMLDGEEGMRAETTQRPTPKESGTALHEDAFGVSVGPQQRQAGAKHKAEEEEEELRMLGPLESIPATISFAREFVLHDSVKSHTISTRESVHFSEEFTAPITVRDAEGLHAVTLSLDMMGRELKKTLLAFEQMVQMRE